MHPYLLPHLMGGCVKHRVKRALVLDPARSTFASLTPAAGAAPNRVFVSFWIKRHKLGSRQGILEAGNAANADVVFWNGNDSLGLSLNGRALITNRLFRDPNAHHHVFIDMNGPSTRIVVDGIEQTSFATDERGLMVAGYKIGKAGELHRLGREQIAGSSYADFTISELYICIGALGLDEFDFGKFDTRSGNWMPIPYTGDVGLNGGYWPMLGDAGDAPATAAEGLKDRAAITGGHIAANNWTPSNFAAADFVKDSPTNFRIGNDYRGNFCTLSPLRQPSVVTLSDGGLMAAFTNNRLQRGTMVLPKSGKWWFEMKCLDSAGAGNYAIGIADSQKDHTGPFSLFAANDGVISYYDQSSKNIDGTLSAYGSAIATNDVVACLFDADADQVTFYRQGVSQGVAASGSVVTSRKGRWMPAVEANAGSRRCQFNAGQRPFYGLDGNGLLPTGARPLCVSALPRPSVIKPPVAFRQTVETGANIAAALAAHRNGWGNEYVQFVKSVASEGWRISFGSAPGFCYDPSNSGAGRVVYPALAGATYWGASLRIGPQYGVAAGTTPHVNGVASIIADGLGITRKVVMLFPRSGGNMPVYHPDATTGELLYLNSAANDAPATDITAVTSSGFSVGAGMATDTYDWLVIAEMSGFIQLGRETGAGSTDGAVVSGDVSPGWHIKKKINSATNSSWVNWNEARNARNPRTAVFYLDLANAEDTTNRELDFLATGVKAKNLNSVYGGASDTYVSITIGAYAFAPGVCPAQATAR